MNKTWQAAVIISAFFFSLAASPSQGPGLDNVMREKLVHAQKMLEAVVTSDWVSLETHSRELERLTSDPRWTVLKFPEYAQRSRAFIQAIQELHQAAARRDLEKTPALFNAVTLRCVECHRYLARARMAQQ